ncbi:MAG: glycoside hydrolase family 172 protein [Clostridia bacterium]
MFDNNLGSLYRLSNARTRSICAENPTGEPGKGAMEFPDENNAGSKLGKGWKIKPCIKVKAGETAVLADYQGSGIIRHIWMTADSRMLRAGILRFYWDGEDKPSVEVPMGDFFAMGHGRRYDVNSIPVVVNPDGALNCYWPMPFRKGFRITFTNEYFEDVRGFFFQITFDETEVDENAAYFHAKWSRSMTTREYPEHVIVDGISGKGHYVGTYLAWMQYSDCWWGEGEIKFYMDDEKEYPTICGTGTEDYFGGAWNFGGDYKDTFGRHYSTPFMGFPFSEREEGKVPKHSMYRWHVMDPIRFENGLKVTIQALGWWPNHKYQPLTEDIASVAYWYQTEPHSEFEKMAELDGRWPR